VFLRPDRAASSWHGGAGRPVARFEGSEVVISVLASIALGLVFSVAIWSKLRSREALSAFVYGLDEFGLASESWRRFFGAGALSAEVIAVSLLVMPVQPLLRFGPAAVLLAGFTVAVAVAGRGRPSFACHCFGAAESTSATAHIVINCVLFCLALAGVLVPETSRTSGDSVLAVGLGLIVGILALTGIPVAEALRPWVRAS